MELVRIALFLDAETLAAFGRQASEAGLTLGEFIADVLAAHFEICSFPDNVRPQPT